MITADADKSHSSTVALWEAFNGAPIMANRVQECVNPQLLFILRVRDAEFKCPI